MHEVTSINVKVGQPEQEMWKLLHLHLLHLQSGYPGHKCLKNCHQYFKLVIETGSRACYIIQYVYITFKSHIQNISNLSVIFQILPFDIRVQYKRL